MSGWIKLHRDINSHWIWSNSDYFKWWVDILLEVNHTPAKVLIKGKIYSCGRGEKLYSLDTWAIRWGTNKSKVKRFLEMLQKDEMICLKNETQTTRITICKYDDYQDVGNASETQVKRKRNASETQVKPIQERKEEEERKEVVIYRKFNHLEITLDEVNKLKEEYDISIIDLVLDKIENYSKNKNYKNLFLTAKNWLKKEKSITETRQPDNVVVWKDGISRVKTPF
jgi:hypothetical protein